MRENAGKQLHLKGFFFRDKWFQCSLDYTTIYITSRKEMLTRIFRCLILRQIEMLLLSDNLWSIKHIQ